MDFNAKEIAKYEKMLGKNYGKYIGTFHEIVTENDLHIDCELFKTKIAGKQFYTLATLGMSNYDMKTDIYEYKNIELMICLPISWDFEKDQWICNLLKLIAKMPKVNNFSLAPFHTVDMKSKIIDGKDFEGIFIEYPRMYLPKKTQYKFGKKYVSYLQIYPIFRKEMEEIVKENEEVMEKIVGYSIFDINRNSVI